MVFIRDGVHSEWCTIGMVSIRDGVHFGWYPFGRVSIRAIVRIPSDCDPPQYLIFPFITNQRPTLFLTIAANRKPFLVKYRASLKTAFFELRLTFILEQYF